MKISFFYNLLQNFIYFKSFPISIPISMTCFRLKRLYLVSRIGFLIKNGNYVGVTFKLDQTQKLWFYQYFLMKFLIWRFYSTLSTQIKLIDIKNYDCDCSKQKILSFLNNVTPTVSVVSVHSIQNFSYLNFITILCLKQVSY